MRFLSLGLVALVSFSLVACPRNRPGPSDVGDERTCPDGTVNAGKTIITVNCRTVVKYDGNEFKSSVKVMKLAEAGVQNVDKTLREVSDAATESQIQFSEICESYNACNTLSAEYNTKLEAMQAHFRRIRESVSLLEAAGDNAEVVREAFSQLYLQTVPAEKVAEASVSLEFSVQARVGGQVRVLRDGESLKAGDEVVFGVRTSQPAHVYIFQKKASGTIDVLFPNADIAVVTNPIPAGQLVRIPPQGQVFTVDDKDLGIETIYVAASKAPLADLNAALAGSGGQSDQAGIAQAMDNLFDEAAPECAEQTRGLELSEEGECGTRTRGLTPKASGSDPFFTDASSVRGQTAPGDDVLIRTFRFRHEQ